MNRDFSRDEDDLTTSIRRPSRRTVLLGVGGVGTAAAIAACGPTSSSDSRQPPGGSGAGTGSGSNGGSGAGAASGGLGATSAIPVGGGKIFPDQLVVVTQPAAGTFKAFAATCTHQGCTVSQVANGLITCPCHGSEYSITDGSVKRGPAPRPLGQKAITVANGEISLG